MQIKCFGKILATYSLPRKKKFVFLLLEKYQSTHPPTGTNDFFIFKEKPKCESPLHVEIECIEKDSLIFAQAIFYHTVFCSLFF